MTSAETLDLIRRFPDVPLWLLQARDSISFDEAVAMMLARRKILKRAS